ncbi:GNAT family N-acetyltransferase [Amycolatopsis magusensis]|uniref:ElaA protein n=1 Tax=Amycolatopsis magusensis TaxID=882444 RepID=A0ABS4Q3W9_9PSEU|nr:GNAT family N-acetyltransferase [Amycolatopsis magusensis]MBP2186381.1 ElaA protein [Amycolatopsis magusensis]
MVRAATGDQVSAGDLYSFLKLRVDVFVVEQECPYPELDGRDLLPGTRHLWLDGASGVDAYLRVLEEPSGGFRIGRVVTAGAARGRGLAGQLMHAALESISDAPAVLDAQTYAKGFYAKFGFEPTGEEFLEDGIPHVTMRR